MAKRRSWRALLVAAFTVAASIALAQPQPAANFDPIRMPPDGQALRITRTEDIPRQLMSALARRCRLDESMLREFPAVIFRPSPGYRPMAIVPCGAIVGYTLAFVFERSMRDEPTLMKFPVIAAGRGFTASERTGIMTWDAASKVITAVQSTDVCSQPLGRHTYQHGSGELNGFTLVKVEVSKHGCGIPEGWRVLWEAEEWNVRP